MITDKQELLNLLNTQHVFLNDIGENLLNDNDVIVELIKRDQGLVNAFGDKLMRNQELMDRVFNETDSTLYHRLSPELKNDPRFMINLINVDSNAIYNIGEDLTNNTEFMKQAVVINPEVYYKLSPEIKNNPQLISDLILKEPKLMQYIEPQLRNNKEFVLAQIDRNYADMFEYVSDDLKKDPDFIKQAVEKRPMIFRHLPEEIKNNKDLWLSALDRNSNNLEVFDTLLSSPEFEQIKNDPEFINKYNEALRKDHMHDNTDLNRETKEDFTIEVANNNQQEKSLVPVDEQEKSRLKNLLGKIKTFFSKKSKEEVQVVDYTDIYKEDTSSISTNPSGNELKDSLRVDNSKEVKEILASINKGNISNERNNSEREI